MVPGATAPEQPEEAGQPAAKPQMQEEIQPAKEPATESLSASEDSFVFVSDVEIVGEHLDEVFYGEGAPADALQQRDDQTGGEAGVRMRRESQRSVKESGSVLFGSEETTLTPIYISPGPPKIIDPILLEEPTAMSFMYSDLYEDAVGEKRKSDEECSEAESVASEKSYKRLSDSEETDGYLEKFILKDETPTVEVQPDSVEDRREGRMMWTQSKFEMTGCLTRVVREEDEDKTKTQEVSVGDSREDSKSAMYEGKGEMVRENEMVGEKMQVSMVTEEQTNRGASEETIQESKLREDQMGDQEVEDKINGDQTEPPESSTTQPLQTSALLDIKEEKTEHQRSAETIISDTSHHLCQTQETVENKAPKATADRAVMLPAGTEVLYITGKSEIPADTTEETFSDKATTDAKTVMAGEVVVTKAPAEVKDPELAGQERSTSAETKTPAAALCEETEAEEILSADVAPVEVITDCAAAVHAVVQVSEKAGDEQNVRTQVQIDLREAKCMKTTDVQTAAPEGEEVCEALTGQIAIESREPEIFTQEESEVKSEGETMKSVMTAQGERGSDKHQHEQQPVTDCASTKTKLIPEAKDTTSAMDSGSNVHEMANVDDELVLLVPKGQAVEMDIEISQYADRTADDAADLSEPDSKCQVLTAPHTNLIIPESLQASNEETMTAPQLEVRAPDVHREETLPCIELDNGCSSPVPVQEVNTEEQKAELDFEKDEDVFSPLRSFSPQEDLSGLHREDIQTEAADAEKQTESHKVEDAIEVVIQETLSPETDLYGEYTGQEMQPCEAAAEAPEVLVEELEYEVICAQDAKEMPEPETQRDAEEPKREPKQETMKIEVAMEEGKVLDLSSGEELIEADYDIIDAEEERQARLAAELQGMDWFCLTCGDLLSEDDYVSGEHHSHDVTGVDVAYEEIKVRHYGNTNTWSHRHDSGSTLMMRSNFSTVQRSNF